MASGHPGSLSHTSLRRPLTLQSSGGRREQACCDLRSSPQASQAERGRNDANTKPTLADPVSSAGQVAPGDPSRTLWSFPAMGREPSPDTVSLHLPLRGLRASPGQAPAWPCTHISVMDSGRLAGMAVRPLPRQSTMPLLQAHMAGQEPEERVQEGTRPASPWPAETGACDLRWPASASPPQIQASGQDRGVQWQFLWMRMSQERLPRAQEVRDSELGCDSGHWSHSRYWSDVC